MKKLIIDAALRMFVEDGYEKTSIRNIADKIEYSPGTIYLYYKDKDELLYAVQKVAFTKMLETFQQEATSRSPWKRLEQIAYSYVNFGIHHPDLYDLMFIIRAPMNTAEKKGDWDNGDACFNYLTDTINECMEKGLLRYSDPRVAALSIWSMGHGLVSLQVRCRFKVMELSDDQVSNMINLSIKEFLRTIKA